MAVAFVQSKAAEAYGSDSHAVTFDVNVGAGNLIVVYAAWDSTVITASVADNLGNSYTNMDGPTAVASAYRAQTWYAKNINGGACTVTVTLSGGTYGHVVVHEISGADITAPLEDSALNAQVDPGTGGDAVTSGTITPSTAGCYIWGATADHTQAAVHNSGTDFTQREQAAGWVTEDLIQGAAAAIAATFTATNANSDFLTAAAAFKPAGAPPAGIVVLRRRRM